MQNGHKSAWRSLFSTNNRDVYSKLAGRALRTGRRTPGRDICVRRCEARVPSKRSTNVAQPLWQPQARVLAPRASSARPRRLHQSVFRTRFRRFADLKMDNSQSDANVVLPDMTEAEQLASEHDEHNGADENNCENCDGVVTTSDPGQRVSVRQVPVTLPVGSLITNTFNVITQDQLSHFKPMLCVDNNFISASDASDGQLKTTHIVIQDAIDERGNSSAACQTTGSWQEAANSPVLPVRCKNTSAELHKARFGSGGRGRCIKLGVSWYTPSEFEALCGRASSKDWKRSIRFGGRSLQTLIDEGILSPHATSCTCSACCDDDTATGPVRLFTPYKRRRRKDTDIDSGSRGSKIRRATSTDPNSQNAQTSDSEDGLTGTATSVSKEEAWQSLAEGLDSTEYQLIDTSAPSDPNTALRRLDELSNSMVRIATEFKRVVDEARELCVRQVERLQRDRESAVLAARVEAQVQALGEGGSDGSTLQPTAGVAGTLDGGEHQKKCANCNREALAECSLCRRTPYCSTFCQRKDWGAHQVECVRGVANDAPQQSIMLIVESSDQQ